MFEYAIFHMLDSIMFHWIMLEIICFLIIYSLLIHIFNELLNWWNIIKKHTFSINWSYNRVLVLIGFHVWTLKLWCE